MKKIKSLWLLFLITSGLQAKESWFVPETMPDEPLHPSAPESKRIARRGVLVF